MGRSGRFALESWEPGSDLVTLCAIVRDETLVEKQDIILVKIAEMAISLLNKGSVGSAELWESVTRFIVLDFDPNRQI